MNLAEYLKTLKRRDKSAHIPGAVEAVLEDACPACGKQMVQLKPCCGHPSGYRACADASCGYKEG
jgi:predicted amidophosphoribosyltransferase